MLDPIKIILFCVEVEARGDTGTVPVAAVWRWSPQLVIHRGDGINPVFFDLDIPATPGIDLNCGFDAASRTYLSKEMMHWTSSV